MGLPSQPVTLSTGQIEELYRRLSTMRHDINNTLSLVTAAAELMRHKPQMAEKMTATLLEQPQKISTLIGQFSKEFEQAFGITRP